MKSNPDTLVILTPGFPKDEQDSTCLPAQQLFVKALNSQFPSLQVIVLAFEYPYSHLPYYWFQNKVIPFNGWDKRKIKKIVIWIAAYRSLKKIKRENHLIGLLSFWCADAALFGKYYSKWQTLKHYIWILGQDARQGNRYISFIRPRAEELVAMSDFLAKEFYRNYSIFPKHVIPNGTGPSPYHDQPESRDIDILGVGSLIPLKQFDLFLSVVRELKDYVPGLKTIICGKGPEEARLKAFIRDWQLQDCVTLTGELPHDEILRLMKSSRILLHPSSYEGFSSACLEALNAGAHVVSLCKPMERSIDHWHIVNREDLVEKTISLLQDPETDYHPVLPYAMNDSAKAVAKLFDYND